MLRSNYNLYLYKKFEVIIIKFHYFYNNIKNEGIQNIYYKWSHKLPKLALILWSFKTSNYHPFLLHHLLSSESCSFLKLWKWRLFFSIRFCQIHSCFFHRISTFFWKVFTFSPLIGNLEVHYIFNSLNKYPAWFWSSQSSLASLFRRCPICSVFYRIW